MGSIDDIMQLCRLCLVKDQVNIPIFDESSDIRQTFLKINACLPVKVSRDDNLPKKICDGCSYKLDMLYIFRNTSVDSEKQLITWLNQAGLTSLSQAVKDGAKPEIMVKQETFETNDSRIEDNPDMGTDAHGEIEDQHPEMGVDAHSYIIQQQKLPYQQDFAFGEPSGSTAGLMAEEPAPKRAKRAASVKKHVPIETEEDELVEAAMQITKAEEEDSDDIDQPEYVEAPSTSADDQPGPSGVGKGTIEAPLLLAVKQEIDLDAVDPLAMPPPPDTDDLSVFVCEICGRTYNTILKLRAHKQFHKEKKHVCDQCPMKFVTPYFLKLHKQKHEVRERSHQCELCNKGFKSKHVLKQHMVIHTKDYKFKCDLCTSGYTTKRGLDDHKMVVHENLRFICETCKKTFRSPSFFQVHLKSHEPGFVPKTWKCEYCSKTFHIKSGFKRHVAIHENTREKVVCETCGKAYYSKTFLVHHMKTHTGQRPFICEVCGKGFIVNDGLKEHMKVHTKEKPYVCTICKKGFTQRGSLKIHMRTHTGKKPYKCNTCSKEYTTRFLLKTHRCTL